MVTYYSTGVATIVNRIPDVVCNDAKSIFFLHRKTHVLDTFRIHEDNMGRSLLMDQGCMASAFTTKSLIPSRFQFSAIE